jgi:hypothetical protein
MINLRTLKIQASWNIAASASAAALAERIATPAK